MKKLFVFFSVAACIVLFSEDRGFSANFVEEIGGSQESNSSAEPMGTIKMSGEFVNGDLLKVSVSAESLSAPVIGVAYHLKYEKEKLAFLRYEPGDFFERGGDPFYLVSDEESGKVIFGETLRREDSFPLGDGLIADFYFQILDGSDFIFSFEKGVVSTLDEVRQDLDAMNWENLTISKTSGFGKFGNLLKTQIEGQNGLWPMIGVIGFLAFTFTFLLSKFWKNEAKKG